MQFHHVGVPTAKPQPGAFYIESVKVRVTNPDQHPYHLELVQIEPGSPLPKELYSHPHVAFTVENVDAAVKGENVLFPPTTVMPNVRIAFIQKDGMYIELMQVG